MPVKRCFLLYSAAGFSSALGSGSAAVSLVSRASGCAVGAAPPSAPGAVLLSASDEVQSVFGDQYRSWLSRSHLYLPSYREGVALSGWSLYSSLHLKCPILLGCKQLTPCTRWGQYTSNSIIKGLLCEVASLIRRIENFIVKYREIQGKTKTDGMRGRKISRRNLSCSFVGLQ